LKRSIKSIRKRNTKRDLFAELSEAMDALADARHGKRTLRAHSMELEPRAPLAPKELIRISINR